MSKRIKEADQYFVKNCKEIERKATKEWSILCSSKTLFFLKKGNEADRIHHIQFNFENILITQWPHYDLFLDLGPNSY